MRCDGDATEEDTLAADCPAVGRLLGRPIHAHQDLSRVLHTDPSCANGGDPRTVLVGNIDPEALCRRCSRTEQGRVRDTHFLMWALGNLRRPLPSGAPRTPFEAATDARAFRLSVGSVEDLTRHLYSDDAAEIRAVAAQARQRWDAWFRTEGARELVTYARCGGTTSVIGDVDLDAVDVDMSQLRTAIGRPFADHALRALAAAYLAGAADPVEAAAGKLLMKGSLYRNVSGDACDATTTAVPRHEGDGSTVEPDPRRQETLAVLREIDSHTIPVDDDGRLTVVAAGNSTWRSMVWSDSLYCAFPSVTVGSVTVMALPKVVADKIAVTARRRSRPAVISASAHLPHGAAVTLMEATAALLGDGMGFKAALATATAVLH